MRILDDDKVIDWMKEENGENHTTTQSLMQVRTTYECGCIITLDIQGFGFLSCNKHKNKAKKFQELKYLSE